MRPTTIHSVLRMLRAPGGHPATFPGPTAFPDPDPAKSLAPGCGQRAFWPLGWGLAGASPDFDYPDPGLPDPGQSDTGPPRQAANG